MKSKIHANNVHLSIKTSLPVRASRTVPVTIINTTDDCFEDLL